MSGQWEGSQRAQRLPEDWESYRRPAVLARDKGFCHVCHKPGATDVDHLNPGDDHSLSNLAAIHAWPCHARKSAREGVAARAARRALRYRPKAKHPGMK